MTDQLALEAVEQGHTGKRVRYTYDGDTWDGWLVTLTPTPYGTQATVKRDDGQNWVVMSENCTPIDAPDAPRPLLDVFVPGRPAPQGSKNARPIYKGRGKNREFTGRVAQVESSAAVAPWRTDIRHATIGERVQQEAVAGPMHVTLAFVMPRPTSTPKRRTPAAVKRPDLDKLIRAVLDAVGSAGCVWLDDSQVVDIHATKRIANVGEAPGCHITIHTPAGAP